MPRKSKVLKPLEVSRLTAVGMHAVGEVAGLYLQVSQPKSSEADPPRSWVLRVVVAGKRREMGLGGYPDVELAAAKARAREIRTQIDNGIDPIEQRRQAKSALRAATAAAITFRECATKYIAAKGSEWRNSKHAQQWQNTLTTYAYKVLGDVLVRDVTLAMVLEVLEPIWTVKTETASRVQGRIASILDWATVRGYRDGPNPARWKGNLDTLLAKPSKVAKPVHHAALPVDDVGAFLKQLRQQQGIGARALEFVILTATRSGEVRGAVWREIDLASAEWRIPAERMKAAREHRVPLSGAAVKLLKALPKAEPDAFVFPAASGGPLSDMTLSAVLRRMKVPAVPHGFRSTFRDWASERTNYPHEVAEMALAHAIAGKTEAAYRRGDLFDKRRMLMRDWGKFCVPPDPSGAVSAP